MHFKRKILSSSCFGLVIICFFFPFIDVKCNDVSLAQVKGIDLVTGSVVHTKDLQLPRVSKDESKEHNFEISDQPIDHNYFAIAALLLATGGLVLSFLIWLKREVLMAVIGFAGGMALLLMRVQIEHSVEGTAGGLGAYVVHLNFVYGYWISMILFFLVGAVNMFDFIEAQQRALVAGES